MNGEGRESDVLGRVTSCRGMRQVRGGVPACEKVVCSMEGRVQARNPCEARSDMKPMADAVQLVARRHGGKRGRWCSPTPAC